MDDQRTSRSVSDGVGVGDSGMNTLAWTRHDGPGQPPPGPRPAVVGVLAGALLLGAIGIFSNDTLCPEHRSWVIALGVIALVGSFATGIALLANRPLAVGLAVIPASCGLAIGVIDAQHNVNRGLAIAAVFALGLLVAVVLTMSAVRSVRWRRRVARSLEPVAVPTQSEASSAGGPLSAQPAATKPSDGIDDAADTHGTLQG